MTNSLQRLLTVRQYAVERARITLGAAVRAEADAEGVLRSIDERSTADRHAIADLMSQDLRFGAVDATSRGWLRQRQEAAKQTCALTRHQAEQCHLALAAARIDAAAVVEMIEERRRWAVMETERVAQRELEDVDRLVRIRANEA